MLNLMTNEGQVHIELLKFILLVEAPCRPI